MLNAAKYGPMIDQLSGNSRLIYTNGELAEVQRFLGHEDLRVYLTRLLTSDGYEVSGVYVHSLDRIRDELLGSPGATLAPHGYLPVASSIGGNAVCFGMDGKVYWADHTGWYEDTISFQNRETGKWKSIPFTKENIPKALVLLAEDVDSFLERFLAGELEDYLDDLD